MNMIYEGIRQKGSMVIVPSSAVETMGLGPLSGMAALAKGEAERSEASERAPQAGTSK